MKSLRPWATPLTIGTTLVTLVTGVLLFFHTAPGLTRPSHEWIGMIMVAAVAAHLALNWRAFKTYFKRPLGLSIIALGVVATALTFFLSPASSQTGGNPIALIMRSMGDAEIADIAALVDKDAARVVADLSAAGTDVDPAQTLSQASGGDRDRELVILRAILAE